MNNEDKKTKIEKEEMVFPIRINHYLNLKQICSRRQADEFIKSGQVKVNGKKAVLGQKIEKDDKVELTSGAKKTTKNYEYYLFNKPQNIVTTNPQYDEKDYSYFFNNRKDIFPIGRLDKNSTGLLLITNDGRLTDKMLNPKFEHEKEYEVKVDKPLKESFSRKIEKGVIIEGYKTKPAKIKITGEKSFNIILTEGKRHQIKRMVMALGYQVLSLNRVRIMNLKLSGIREGKHRKLTEKEITELLGKLDIKI